MENSQNRIRLIPEHLQPTQQGRMPLKSFDPLGAGWG